MSNIDFTDKNRSCAWRGLFSMRPYGTRGSWASSEAMSGIDFTNKNRFCGCRGFAASRRERSWLTREKYSLAWVSYIPARLLRRRLPKLLKAEPQCELRYSRLIDL